DDEHRRRREREPHHLEPRRGVDARAALLPRAAGRYEAQFVELQRLARRARQREVADVDRIEGAAQQANASTHVRPSRAGPGIRAASLRATPTPGASRSAIGPAAASSTGS